eukprot:gene1188-403_t
MSDSSVDEGLDNDDFDMFPEDIMLGHSQSPDNANQNSTSVTDNNNNNSNSAAASGSQERMMQVKWPLLTSLEVPGDVRNEENVLKKLGGIDSLCRNLNEENPQCSLDMGPYHGKLNGSVSKVSNVLIKARRHKLTGEIQTQVIGVVNESVRFDSMADYHFLPPENFRREQRTIEEDLEAKAENVFLPPPRFSSWEQPYAYHFEENVFTKNSNAKSAKSAPANISKYDGQDDESVLKNLRWIELPTLHFADLKANSILKEPPKGLLKDLNAMENEILSHLQKLFQKQPVWLRSALEAELPDTFQKQNWMQKPLSCVAYFIKDGPFRMSYARLGYNPATDKKSKMFQVIDFRDTFFKVNGFLENINDSSVDITKKQRDFKFLEPPAQRSVLYMFVNIEDVSVQRVIKSGGTNQECKSDLGWYTKKEMDEIRNCMKVKSAQMRKMKGQGSFAALTNATTINKKC